MGKRIEVTELKMVSISSSWTYEGTVDAREDVRYEAEHGG